MISIFSYQEFRKYILDRFGEMPRGGHGQSRKLASFVGIHTTLVSQILNGTRCLTAEQAALTCEFLGLSELETDYFMNLIRLDRAGNVQLKKILRRNLDQLRQTSTQLSSRLKSDRKLSESERATFYSDWSYSAVRQLSAIPDYRTVAELEKHLGLPSKQLRQIIDFLLKAGLCVEKDGRITVGPKGTHLEASSPWINSHHRNWRQKGLERLNYDEPARLHYSAPMTLSSEDALKVKEMITQFLERLDSLIDKSPSEEARCLNIDWFRF